MSKPVRIQLSRKKGWKMPPNTVKVARPSLWGNPWVVGIDGRAEHCIEEFRRWVTGKPVMGWPKTVKDCIHVYHEWGPHMLPLRGKNLACWCALDAPCHADVLLELANQ